MAKQKTCKKARNEVKWPAPAVTPLLLRGVTPTWNLILTFERPQPQKKKDEQCVCVFIVIPLSNTKGSNLLTYGWRWERPRQGYDLPPLQSRS